MTLDQTRRARDRGGNRSGIDLRAAAVFRDVKQHSAAREIDLPCCFLKAENRIGSEARQSLIRERELGPGINTCAHGSAIADFITVPMSLIVGEPISAMTSFTIAVISASPAACGI